MKVSKKLEKDLLSRRWKKIILDNVESKYQVSDDGFILNTKTGKLMGSIPHKTTGYKSVTMCQNGKSYTYGIHVLVATYFIDKPIGKEDVKLEVNHKDGNKINNDYRNLEWVTRAENVQHAFKTGLNKAHPRKGSDHWNAKYPESLIHDICKLLEKGKQPKEISKLLNVPVDLPGHIKYHNGWSDISKQYEIVQSNEIPRGPMLVPQKSKKYPPELIRGVCEMIIDGKSDRVISETLNVPRGFSSDIKRGQIWRFYSEQYDFPYTASRKPSELNVMVNNAFKSGIYDEDKIIDMYGIPDEPEVHEYINNVKKLYKS